MQVVAHNLVSQNAQRQFKLVSGGKAKSSEKLGSGYRINRAADDAAGLAISEKMRAQIRGLDKATDNISHGISFVQVADGALNEIHSMIHRMKELATQASNDTNSDTDREQLNNEVKQLKKEINRVFNTTEFNTKPIFKSPYSLGVTDDPEPLDIQLFNTTEANNSPNGTSGIIVNSRRYTWEEMGASVTNGVFDNDWEFDYVDGTANNGDGERIHMYASAGSTIDQAFRRYHVTADSEGLYVNKVPAARWDDTAATGKWAGVPAVPDSDGEYTFTYHGMEVSFVPDEEDGREEMIEHLNPTELDPEDKVLYWDVKIDKANSETAVNSTYGQFILDVTNENKNDIEDFRYKVTADENGVKLEQIIGNDSISHKNIAWSDFVNTATGEPFKFTDWGEENSENPQSQTFDNSATYVYKDTEGDSRMRTPLVFSFTVADESSKEAIINGLNLEVEYNGVSSPVTMAAVEPYSYYARLTDGASAWTTQKLSNFHFQRDDLGRNFDDAVSPMTGTIVRTSHSGTPTDSSATTVDTYTHADVMREAYVEKTVRTYKMEATTDANGLNQGETRDELTWTPTYKAVLDSTDTSKVTLGSQTSIDDETYPYSASDRWSDDTLTFTVTTYTRKGNGEVQLYTQNDNDTNFTARDNSVNDLFEKHARATDPSQQTGNLGEDYCRYTSTSLSGSGAKYIDIGDTMLQEKRYDQKYYTYSYNATGGKSNLMAGTSGSFLDTTSGIYSYELQGTIAGENKEDSIYLTNSDGSQSRYDTNLLCGRTIELRTTANSSAYGANVSIMNIWYDDRLDHPDRSGNNDSTNIKITMPDEATVRFSKQRASKGSSLETHFKIEVPPPPEKLLHIQSGSQPWQSIDLIWRGMSLSSIGLGGANVTTYDKAQRTMALADAATDIVSSARANFGAYQNRLEHAYDIDNNTSENTSYAESRIRDTDMAKEMVNYSKHSILEQAGLSVLSQANSANQGVISLLG